MLTSTHASRMQSGTVRKNVLAHGRENRCRPALPGFFRNEGNATQGLYSQGRCNAAALALYRTCQQQQDIRRMHVAVI